MADKSHVIRPVLSIYIKKHAEIILSFFVASVLFYEGFFVLAFGVNEAGVLNPFIAIFLFLFGVVWFAKNNIIDWHVLFFFLLSCLFFVIGSFSRGEDGIAKSLRDFIYLAIIFLFFFCFHVINKRGDFSPKKFVLFLGIFTIIIYPPLGALLDFTAYEGRFPGFSLSPPVFANGVLLTYLIYRSVESQQSFFGISLFLLSCFFILLSGTRSPFVMLVLYEAMFLLANSRRQGRIVALFVVMAFLSFAAFLVFGSYDFRVFSLEDIENGSLSTRLYWYVLLFKDVVESGFIGGFGSGSAEEKLGHIPHFDFLRLWYDYSIFCIIFIFFLFCSMVGSSGFRFSFLSAKKFFVEVSLLGVSIVNLIFLSMHNALQVPGLVLLIAIWFSFFYPSVLAREKLYVKY